MGDVIVGGWMVGRAVGASSSGLRCLKVEEVRSAEVVVDDASSSMSSDGSMAIFGASSRPAFVLVWFSLPSVMAAVPPKLFQGSHSHCGGRRMTKTTDATMSEMPSRAMLGC